MGWSQPERYPTCPGSEVSIPERVWGGLERDHGFGVELAPAVSIPERVWGGLEPVDKDCGVPLIYVSIPERVWGGLEHFALVVLLWGKPGFNP